MVRLVWCGTDLDVVDKLIDFGPVKVEGNKVEFTLASASSEPVLVPSACVSVMC